MVRQSRSKQSDGEFLQVQNAPDDPVVDLEEDSPDDLANDPLFDFSDLPEPSVVNDPTSFSDAIQSDPRFHSPVSRGIKGTPDAMRPAAVGGDGHNPLAALIEQQVRDLVAQHLGNIGLNTNAISGTPLISPEQLGKPVYEPPKWTKHYRSDIYPDNKIQELDMSALDRGERPQANPIPGSHIVFRRGHLYLGEGDENKIRQIEWMRNNASISASGEHVIGGNPSIYEDDGGDVFRCPQGCDYFTASKNAYKAHMRATHGVIV